jgi:hypothetical protein
MAQAQTWHWRLRTANESLAQAFLLSLLLHAILFGSLELGYRFDLWRHSPLALLSKWLHPKLAQAAAASAKKDQTRKPPVERPAQEVPVIFVDVDPAQATAELPDETRYYSAVPSRAANPNTTRETGQPQLDGRQNVVFKTADSDRAKPAETPPPAPVVAQPINTGEDVAIAKPKETVAISPPPLEQLKPKPTVQEPRAETKPGDLAMAKPGPEIMQPALQATAPNQPDSADAPKPRPRTIAAARAQMNQNPMSALVGERMAQDGGVKRCSIQSSLEVRASPLGNYDARFIAAVQQCWYALLEEQHFSLDRMGKVVLDFRLTVDGRITDMRVAESSVGDLYTTICQLAITKPSPYERWPGDVRRMVGADFREIRFTFFY